MYVVVVVAHIAGTVEIGSGTWGGAGATVSNNLKICNDCMIGAWAVVIENINSQGIYIGCPARKIEKQIRNDCIYENSNYDSDCPFYDRTIQYE